ncbi:MAG: hypothetical protein HY875_01100 [Chloroflexi bacterium]|nr:hypothetical protein [Chloroflexota bacterium]
MGGPGNLMKNRLAVVGTFASLAALILLAVVVWKFGTKDPSPPSLSKHPDAAITGEILYIRGECIVRAAASGASKQTVSCPAPNGVSWVDARTARYWRFGPGVPTAVDVDLATGAESLAQVPPGTSPPTGWDMVSPRGETASFDKDGSLYRSTPGEAARVLIFEYDGPESRRPEFLTWSPDGEWVLLFYPAKEYDRGELWIVRRDGTSAGTLAGGVARSASWWIDGKGFLPALQ